MNDSGKLTVTDRDGRIQTHYIVDVAEIIGIIGLIVLIILFGGTPDIADGIIHWLMN